MACSQTIQGSGNPALARVEALIPYYDLACHRVAIVFVQRNWNGTASDAIRYGIDSRHVRKKLNLV